MRYPQLKPISKDEEERSLSRQRALVALADIERIDKALASGSPSMAKELHIELDGSYQSSIKNWGTSVYAHFGEHGLNYEYLGDGAIMHNLNTMKGKLKGYVIQLDPSVLNKAASLEKTEGIIGKNMTAKQRKLLADYGRIKQLSVGNSAINIADKDFPALQEILEYLSAHGFIHPVDVTSGFGRVYMKERSFESFTEQLLSQEEEIDAVREQVFNKQKVFIVHGHDEALLNKIENLLHRIGLEPIILKNEANAGKTIIEKLEHYTDVGFCIVLYTCCDEGRKKGDSGFQCRARQNVVFEHGYLCAKLGRKRVVALKEEQVEFPSDLAGVVYINLQYSKRLGWSLSP